MKLLLKIWRQRGPREKGQLTDYPVEDIDPGMSFLEVLDQLNESLVLKGERAIEFDHDCREGICGQCALTISGRVHGPIENTTTCQLHMRSFSDGEVITIEPLRARAFPIIRDLKIDRSAFDRIIQAGGFISTPTGDAPDANTISITHDRVESAFDSAACIGCGACVATCKNYSAALFTSAKVSHLAKLPQGQAERKNRVMAMVEQMDAEGFGHCTNTGACAFECPQEIDLANIGRMNYEYWRARVQSLMN